MKSLPYRFAFACTVLPTLAFAAPAPANSPYLPSKLIAGIAWGDTLRIGDGSNTGDNWAITWVDKDTQFASYGDGRGFGRRDPRLSLGFARITGIPPNHRGEDVPTNIDTPQGEGPKGIKSSGLLAVDGVLYLFVRNYKVGDDWKHSRLAWSRDGGRTWEWADWHFSETFSVPVFMQFGPNYTGARDNFVYISSQDNASAYDYAPQTVLGRVPKEKIAERASYEFFAGFAPRGEPLWTRAIGERKPIFSDPRGTKRSSISYNSALKRYFLTSSHRHERLDDPNVSKESHTTALGVFDAPEPWGPWTTVFYDEKWAGEHPAFHHRLPPAWMSADGLSMWIVFAGLKGGNYTLCTRHAKLIRAGSPGR